jgi:hypothetical protein
MSGRVILVTAVGAATGSRAAAAALACAGSEPDRAGLLIDVGARQPRPTLVASAGARELEERLAVHLPKWRAASRGETCHLAVSAGPPDFEGLRAALPLVRDSVAVLHIPPALLHLVLEQEGVAPTAVLLRADLVSDRPLTALAVRELIGRQLTVKVLKRPLAWVPARRALFGLLPANALGGLSSRFTAGILEKHSSLEHRCYDDDDDTQADPEGTEERQRRDHARAGRWGGLHRHPQREAGR